jgi:hypothetical protein
VVVSAVRRSHFRVSPLRELLDESFQVRGPFRTIGEGLLRAIQQQSTAVGRPHPLRPSRLAPSCHVAAIMRRPGAPREMTLYVNNKPCQRRLGCDRTLKYQLPPGATLTVYWPGGRKVYIGGEGEPP